MEIPVAISQDVEDLGTALQNWIIPENLDGHWSCDDCGGGGMDGGRDMREKKREERKEGRGEKLNFGKVPALKGMKIASASKFIVFQLKRFTYDPKTWQRIKLNHRYHFFFPGQK
jgi:hypothetical protein